MGGNAHDRCNRAREWASLRADGELSELERLLLRRHLGRCESCRSFAESLTATVTVLRTAPVERPSRSLAPETAARRPVRRFRRRVALGFALLAVAVGAGGLIGGLVGGSGSGPSPSQPAPDIALRPDTGSQVTPTPPNRPVVEPPGEPV
jgi:predicted anti-sigma-YlaC factor YlaD